MGWGAVGRSRPPLLASLFFFLIVWRARTSRRPPWLRPHARPRTPRRDLQPPHLGAAQPGPAIEPGPRAWEGAGAGRHMDAHDTPPFFLSAGTPPLPRSQPPSLSSPLPSRHSHPLRPGRRLHHPARGGPPAPAARACVCGREREEVGGGGPVAAPKTIRTSPHLIPSSPFPSPFNRRAPATPSPPPTWRSSLTTRTAGSPWTGRKSACAARSG